MRVFLRFAWRDMRDSAAAWIVLLAVLPVVIWISRISDARMALTAGGYTGFGFLTWYVMLVWGLAGGQGGLPREYLLSLPYPRRRLFALQIARSAVGALPLMVVVAARAGELARGLGFERYPVGFLWGAPSWARGVVFVLGIVGGFLFAAPSYLQGQLALRTATRFRRFVFFAGSVALVFVDSTFGWAWFMSFFAPFPLWPALVAAAAAYSALRLRMSYVQWRWGTDARWWRR